MIDQFSDFLQKEEIEEIKKQIESLEKRKQKLIIPTTYNFKIGNIYGQDYISDVEEDDLE